MTTKRTMDLRKVLRVASEKESNVLELITLERDGEFLSTWSTCILVEC